MQTLRSRTWPRSSTATLTGMKKHVEASWSRPGSSPRRRSGACGPASLRPAPTGGRAGMDRGIPPALGSTLRRVGQGCRGAETEGEGRWTQKKESEDTPMKNHTTAERKSERELVPSRELSTPRRASCSRRGPSPSCSSGGGHRSRAWHLHAFLRGGCSCGGSYRFVFHVRQRCLRSSPWRSSASTSKWTQKTTPARQDQ